MKAKLLPVLVTLGMLMIAAAVVAPFFSGLDNEWFRYVYAIGALLMLAARLLGQYEGTNLRLKRLHRIEMWSSIFFCVGAFFLFYPPGNNFRDVLAFTLAGAAIQIYTSIMIPRYERKEQ